MRNRPQLRELRWPRSRSCRATAARKSPRLASTRRHVCAAWSKGGSSTGGAGHGNLLPLMVAMEVYAHHPDRSLGARLWDQAQAFAQRCDAKELRMGLLRSLQWVVPRRQSADVDRGRARPPVPGRARHSSKVPGVGVGVGHLERSAHPVVPGISCVVGCPRHLRRRHRPRLQRGGLGGARHRRLVHTSDNRDEPEAAVRPDTGASGQPAGMGGLGSCGSRSGFRIGPGGHASVRAESAASARSPRGGARRVPPVSPGRSVDPVDRGAPERHVPQA